MGNRTARARCRPRATSALACFLGFLAFSPSVSDATLEFDAPYLAVDLGASPRSVRSGDLDGDGRPDLVLLTMQSYPYRLHLTILHGRGDGTFDPPRFLDEAVQETGHVEIADLNRDSRLDIVVGGSTDSLTVLLGNGDGSFGAAARYAASPIRRFALGDLNGDGFADVAETLAAVDSLAIRLNRGDGSLEPRTLHAMGHLPTAVAIGDVDRDGQADIVVTCPGSSAVTLLRGRGDGSFLSRSDFRAGAYPKEVAIADLNGDGRADLAVADENDTAISVLLQNTDGTLGPRQRDFMTSGRVLDLACGDLDGDGEPDLAMVSSWGDFSVMRGRGDGTFGAHTEFPTSKWPRSLVLVDANLDGRLDAVTTHSERMTASVLLGNGDGSFGKGTFLETRSAPGAVAIGDLNDDGLQDLAVAMSPFTVFLGRGDGSFSPRAEFESYVGRRIAVGDLNGDGRTDVAMTESNVAVMLLATGPGTFGLPSFVESGWGSCNDVAIADLDRDGRADLVLAREDWSAPTGVSVLLGRGDGSFGPRRDFSAGSSATALALGDLDGDGDTDAVVTGYNSLSVLLGNGDGTFGPASTIPVGTNLAAICLGDLDADGRPDAVVVGQSSVFTLLNRGDASFGPPRTFAAGDRCASVAVGDLDGDGLLDVAAANTGANTVALLRGRGDGTLDPKLELGTLDEPFVRIGDLDGDGRPDLAVTGASSIVVMTNRSRIVPVEVADLIAVPGDADIRISWVLSTEAVNSLRGVRLVRAGAPEGPFEDRSGVLAPRRLMEFEDAEVTSEGDYWYRLVLVDGEGSQRPAPAIVGPVRVLAPRTTILHPLVDEAGAAIPIRYSVAQPAASVHLAIYDARGRMVWRSEDTVHEAGNYSESWNRRDGAGMRVARGVYFVRLSAGRVAVTRRLVLLHS